MARPGEIQDDQRDKGFDAFINCSPGDAAIAAGPRVTVEGIGVLSDGRILLKTDRAGLFIGEDGGTGFRDFDLGVAEFTRSAVRHAVTAGQAPKKYVVIPPHAVGGDTPWQYRRLGTWERLERALTRHTR